MLPPLKHLPVNWMDGMKIARHHFVQLEDALTDQLRDASAMRLADYDYGLLPPLPGSKQSLEMVMDFDRSGLLSVRVLECRAVTPGGARIEIGRADTRTAHTAAQPLRTDFKADTYQGLEFDVVLVVNPFARVPAGLPDPEESPLRSPYALPAYRLEVVPHPQTYKQDYGAYQLTLARIRAANDEFKAVEGYIPACTSVDSHPLLLAVFHKIAASLNETELTATRIVRKVRAKAQRSPLDGNIQFLAEKIAFFLADTKDHYRLVLPQQPPVYVVAYLARFARLVHTALECMPEKEKEELLNYFSEWEGLTPADFMNALRGLLALDYDHADTNASLKRVETFAVLIQNLSKRLDGLNYLALPDEKKLYGWLVIHTDGKPAEVFEIQKKSTVIGRIYPGESGQQADIHIPGDTFLSRWHAELLVTDTEGTGYFIVDLESTNGTFVHLDYQKKLKPKQRHELRDGDTFQVGETNLVFKSTATTQSHRDALQSVARRPYLKPYDVRQAVG